MALVVPLLLLLGAAAEALAAAPPPLEPPPQPVPVPRRPQPDWSWDTIPLAFHGANRSGAYNETTVRTLAKYQLVTIVRASRGARPASSLRAACPLCVRR